MKYALVGNHPEDLASGQLVGVGEQFDLKKDEVEDPHNARLIEEGIVIPVPTKKGAGNEGGDD